MFMMDSFHSLNKKHQQHQQTRVKSSNPPVSESFHQMSSSAGRSYSHQYHDLEWPHHWYQPCMENWLFTLSSPLLTAVHRFLWYLQSLNNCICWENIHNGVRSKYKNILCWFYFLKLFVLCVSNNFSFTGGAVCAGGETRHSQIDGVYYRIVDGEVCPH